MAGLFWLLLMCLYTYGYRNCTYIFIMVVERRDYAIRAIVLYVTCSVFLCAVLAFFFFILGSYLLSCCIFALHIN
jgi:hypothetical protein